ncbi:hypothetical protein LTR85_002438 [Meristemomyces frigidus]|nr:hypothetical protein LTR85_002438 [Meristemomyces frigidus]
MPVRKVILITGATGGIGRATSIAFAKTGQYDLALHYNAASQETRDDLLSNIISASPTPDVMVHFFEADMGNYDSVRKLHEDVTDTFNKVDVLFNNAGAVLGHQGTQNLADVPIDIFEQTWRVNTGSGILLTQLCLPDMEKQGWGRIIFDSSVAAFTGGFVGPHYASSKSAQHGFVHWLANSVAKKGITVNAVAPALITGTTMMGSAEDEETEKRLAQSKYMHAYLLVVKWRGFQVLNADVLFVGLPVGRLGRPEEIAETVLWMVNTAYVTNKVITIDGGMYPY